MFSVRFAAVRLLSSRSAAIALKPRSITTFASVPTKSPRIATSIQFQRRWMTSEGEAKKEDEVPISELQPTPQEEVENAIHADSAAPTPEAMSEPTADVTEPQAVQGSVGSAFEPREPVDDVVETSNQSSPQKSYSPEPTRPFRGAPTPKPTVYVGNLFFDVTENDLQKEFEKFGTINRIRLIRDSRGLSKGFGYILFSTIEAAEKAIEELNQQLFEGRRMAVSFAHTDENTQREPRDNGPRNPPSKTLFIGNMSFEMTDRDLNNLFRGIRNVIDVRVAIDRRTGQPRGFAHADFTDVKSAMEALKVLADKENYGRKLRVDYSYGPSNAPRNVPR